MHDVPSPPAKAATPEDAPAVRPGLAARVAGLSRWRRRGLAMALGAVATLALPPVFLVPALWLAFPGLVLVLAAARTRRAAFGAGWWFGFGHYSAGVYWIAHALLVDPWRFGWLIPVAVLGLGGVLAVFSGLATLAAGATRFTGAARVLALAAAWPVAEWVRSWIFTGFPWNLTGSVWAVSDVFMQPAAVVGTYGLSLLTVAAAGLPAVLAEPGGAAGKRRALAASLGVVLVLGGFGAVRLHGAVTTMVPGVTLRLVQAAVEQTNKWRDDLREAHLREHVRLSLEPAAVPVTHVVWPETAASFFLDLDSVHRAEAAAAAPVGGLLLTGAPRATPRNVQPFKIWNSLDAITHAGRVVDVYDKVHLVPFGEYVPLRNILPIPKITEGGVDFSAGPALRTLHLPGLPPVGPLICYEVIFPGEVVDTSDRPRWLLNVTNDGWFGLSAGPYQHLAAARLRAVEEGLPLVRSANTGVSAVIDGYGRVVAELGLGRKGVLDSALPEPPFGLTLYAQWGNYVPALLVVLTVGVALACQRRVRNKGNTS